MRNAWTLLLTLGMSALPATAGAQAWVGDPNSLTVNVGYNFGFASKILESGGAPALDGVRSFQHFITFGVEYVTPLDGLAASVSLPLLGVQFKGQDAPENDILRPHGSYDDKSTHFLTTDFRADIRYQIKAIEEYLALAIDVGGSIPTQDYETQGFASAGRGLKQLHFGLAVGRTIEPVLPALYVHVSYFFNFVERFKTDFPETGDVSQLYSNIAAQIGYFILPELQVNIATDIRLAHGGVNFVDWLELTQAQRDFHDPLLRENAYLLGGGIAYDIIEGLNVALLGRAFLGGTNTRDAHLVGLNISYQIF
jgi:hypothetical protein